MNTPRFNGRDRSSPERQFLIATLILILIISGAIRWDTVSARPAKPITLPVKPVSLNAAATQTTITTIAGGGFGSNTLAKLAPMALPTGIALDPLGRGFYVIDDANGSSLTRFVNTTVNPVTLAGVTIQPNCINLIAGGGSQTNDGVPPRDADLGAISGIAVDPTGNILYLAVPSYSAIRVVNLGEQNATVYGKSIAPATIISVATLDLTEFRALAIQPITREIYFTSGRLVLKLLDSGAPTPVAGGAPPSSSNGDGGPATKARLITPIGIVFDSANNLLIADGGDPRGQMGSVRKVTPGGIISSLATGLEFPTGIAIAPDNVVYVALGNAQQIMRIMSSGVKSIVAGTMDLRTCDRNMNPTCGDNAPATEAYLNIPDSSINITLTLAADAKGVYLPDYRFKRVRYVNLNGAAVSVAGVIVAPMQINTIAGSGLNSPYDNTAATSAEISAPTGVTVDARGNLFISDSGNNRLRFVNRTAAPVTLFAVTPYAMTVQPGQIVTLNRDVGEEQLDDRITTAIFSTPQGLAVIPNGVLIVDSQAGSLIKIPPTSVSGRRSGVVRFLNTSSGDVTFFPNGGETKVIIPPGHIKDIAGVRPPTNPQTLGDGMAANKIAFFPTDIAVDQSGAIFLADQGNNRIRRIDPKTGIVSTVYGDGSTQTLNGPTGIAFDNTGRLHIADTRNNRIIRQNFAGGGIFTEIANAAVNIRQPRDLTIDNTGRIFVMNSGTSQVLDLDSSGLSSGAASGQIGVAAGTGSPGFSGDEGPGALARLNLPNPGLYTNDIQITLNILTLPNGDMVFADAGNNRIRRLQPGLSTPPVATVSAASFAGNELAGESIVAAFGARLSSGSQVASSIPLPTTLAGTRVRIRDSQGAERSAPLFYAGPTQVNLQIPEGTVNGPATVTVISNDNTVSTGIITISSIAPGLFTANASGQGVATAAVLRLKSDGTQIYEPVAQFDASQNKFVPVPLDPGVSSDQLFLILYGTGFRFRSSLMAVTATVGGINVETLYAGPVGGFVGLDQSNIRLPRALAGRGVVDVVLTIDGKSSNKVSIQIK
jgi:uncharacterized protein (TIGR03437 family)